MSTIGENVFDAAKAGTMSLSELQSMFAGASSSLVTVEDWGVCYNSGTGQLSEYCTVTSNNPGNPITGIGMIAYSSDGSQTYAVQYTNNFNGPVVSTSIGTTLYNPNDGNQVQCVVYGWTDQGSFFFVQMMTTVPCV